MKGEEGEKMRKFIADLKNNPDQKAIIKIAIGSVIAGLCVSKFFGLI